MEKTASIKKNYFYSMLYQGLIMVLPLITAPYLSRVVGAEGTGIYAFTYSIAQYFVYFGMLGISNYGNRGIAKVRDDKEERNKLFSSVYELQIITASVSVVCYLLYCLFFVSNHKNIALLQCFFVASSIFDISWLFWGMENFKVTVTRQIFVKIATAVGIFVFVKSPGDLYKYTIILSGSTLVSQVYLFLNIKEYVSFKKVDFKYAFSHFKCVFILVIPIIATSIYRVMDKVMIGAFSNVTEVGYYEYSDKLITTCLGVVGALGSVMLPKMANLVSKGDTEQQNKYLVKSIEVTMLIAFAIAFGISSVADVFVPFFYGSEYVPSIVVTIILCISVPFIAWANVVRMQYLIPNEKDKTYVISIVLGALINVCLNCILIPSYGAQGAAIATLSAEALVMIVQTICSSKAIPVNKFVIKSIPFLIIGISMFVLVRTMFWLLGHTVVSLFIAIVVGGIWYVLVSFIYLYLSKNEIAVSLFNKLRFKSLN